MPGIDANTVLMLHMNGADASTTFTDDSASAHADTAVGNAQIDTAQSKFGGASGLFDGTGDGVTFPNSTDWDWGSGDFTIDAWVRFNAIGNNTVYARTTSGVSYTYFTFEGTGLRFRDYNGANNIDFTRTVTISTGVWYHVAVTRSGNNFRMFLDGIQQGATYVNSNAFIARTDNIEIGSGTFNGGYVFDGHLDEVRISKGIARWTTDFTPPTEEYSSGENIEVNETITLSDDIEVLTNPEQIQVNETITLDDQETILTNPEVISVNETINLDDVNNAVIPFQAAYGSKIISVNPLIFVTFESPAQIIEVDTTTPSTPILTQTTIVGAEYATDVAYNSATDLIYVSCADGKLIEIDFNDHSIQTIIDLSDSDNLTTVETSPLTGLTYTGTENSVGELYVIDGRDTQIIDSDFQLIVPQFLIIESDFNIIEGYNIDSDFQFISEQTVIMNCDFKFNPAPIDQCDITDLEDFRVFIDSVELQDTDLILDSITITRASDQKTKATFRLSRKHDSLNTTLDGITSTITNQNEVRIDINNKTEFEGRISSLDCNYNSTDDITVNCLASEASCKLTNITLSLPSLDKRLGIYDVLMQSPTIDNPYIDPNDQNPPYYKGIIADIGDVVEESLARRTFFDSLGKDAERIQDGTFFALQNHTYFWSPTVRRFGKESNRSVNADGESFISGTDFTDGFGNSFTIGKFDLEFFQFNSVNQELANPDGSTSSGFGKTSIISFDYIGTSLAPVSSDLWDLINAKHRRQRVFDDIVQASTNIDDIKSSGQSSFVLSDTPSFGLGSIISVQVNGRDVDYTFTGPKTVNITDGTKSNDRVVIEYGLNDYAVGSAPYQRISVRNGKFVPKFKWVDEPNGLYSIREAGYDFTEYVKQVVDLEYQKLLNINGDVLPRTSATLTVTVDCLQYYDINLLTRINIDNTTESGVFKNNNGFPGNVKSITITSSDRKAIIQCDNSKSDKELKDLDGQFPNEESDEFNDEEKRVLVALKSDMKSRLLVQ